MNRNRIIVLFVVFLVGIAVFNNLNASGNEKNKAAAKVERAQEGFAAPSFELRGMDGQTYNLKDLNKPVVINFWASWCGPCRLEAPELVKLYDEYKDRLEIYAVNLTANDNLDDAKAFVEEYGFTFPVLLDEKGEVAAKYNVQAIPSTYFVNENGIIEQKAVGLMPPDQLKRAFEKLAH
ncbi:TlpA disulfide reductase family protein [Bacillaceae bacterium]